MASKEKRKSYSACLTGFNMSTQSSRSTWTNASLENTGNNEFWEQIQELNKDVDTTLEFVCGVGEIVCTTIPANIVLIVLLGCTAGETAIGVKYLENCPVEPRIPIFLFVGGCFGMLKLLHCLYNNNKLRRHATYPISDPDNERSHGLINIVDLVLNIFLIIWKSLGTFWTLSVWPPYYKPPTDQPRNWCEETLYVYALLTIGISLSLVLGNIIVQFSLALCYKYTNLFES